MGESTEVYYCESFKAIWINCPCYLGFLKVKLWEDITIAMYSEESMVL